ncbi:MAG: hypothetical protein AB7S26_10500 [Sandaracinaceae bacterium]
MFRFYDSAASGDNVDRHIEMRLLVFPGVHRFGNNEDRPFAPEDLDTSGDEEITLRPGSTPRPIRRTKPFALGLDQDKLDLALGRLRIQMNAWRRPFEVNDHGRTIHYRIDIDLVKSPDPRPVLYCDHLGPYSVEWVDRSGQPGRRHASVAAEANAGGFDGVVIVYDNLLSDNPHAMCIAEDGRLTAPDWRSSPMSSCANLMRVDYDRALSPGELTAAHELGHMMGLGHHETGSLMESAAGSMRALSDADRLTLHQVCETFDARRGVRGTRAARVVPSPEAQPRHPGSSARPPQIYVSRR